MNQNTTILHSKTLFKSNSISKSEVKEPINSHSESLIPLLPMTDQTINVFLKAWYVIPQQPVLVDYFIDNTSNYTNCEA